MADIQSIFQIAGSGMSAERMRLQMIASNMANARTTRAENGGGVYRRKIPVFEAQSMDRFGDELDRATSEVDVKKIETDMRDPIRVFDPSHPDADADGYVLYPNVNILSEMVDMMAASRTFEANASVLESTRDMAMRALEIGR